jgi:DNA-binding GntR family transcriptional regulator
MSRGSIREALNRLAATGVVELTPQRGAKIRVLMIDEAIDILVIVEGLVGIAARLAALRINRPGAREKLSVALKSLTDFEPSSRTAEYAIARDTFYAALTSIANNAELSRILPTVRIHLIRVQFRAVMRSADRRRHADYLRITEAVLSGDPVAAEAGARAHMRRLIKVLSSFRDANRS